MRKFILTVALLGLVTPLPLMAQQSKAPAAKPATGQAAPAKPTPEQQADFRRGIAIFRAFNAAIDSDKVQNQVKTRLVACLYTNKLGDISRAAGQVLANNPNMKDDNAGDIYRAAAGVCGIVFKKTDGAAPAK